MLHAWHAPPVQESWSGEVGEAERLAVCVELKQQACFVMWCYIFCGMVSWGMSWLVRVWDGLTYTPTAMGIILESTLSQQQNKNPVPSSDAGHRLQ